MRRSSSLAALLFLAAAWPSRAAAEETAQASDDLDLVRLLNVEVSTATKTSESLSEAPAVITVVTRDDIHRWGYRNVAEVLNHCVGFYMVDDHILPNVGVRGMMAGLGAPSGVIKVMIDGRSVADRATSGNWLGAELIALESVKQIEIIRGPASALYGADAFLGVVNIITEAPSDGRPIRVRSFTGVSGNNPSEQLEAVSGGQFGRFDYLVGMSGEYGSRSGLRLPSQSPSPTLPSYVGNRTTADNLDRRSLGLQARVGYRVPDKGQLVVSAYASGFERGGDFAQWAQLTNGTDAEGNSVGSTVSQGQWRANLDALVHATNTLDLALQTTYFRGIFLSADRIETGYDTWYAERDTSYRGVDSVAEARFVPSKVFNLIVGTEGVFDRQYLPVPERISKATGQAAADNGANDQTINLFNFGAYVSSNLRVIDEVLKVTGGLRYDHHSTYGSQVTGRLGLTTRWSKSLVGKVLYGSAFKAPSPYLLYASPLRDRDVQGNIDLRPQNIHTVEQQISYSPSPFFGLTTGVSYNWLLDKAEFSPQGINQVARNNASQTSLTWESRVDVKHYEDYNIYASAELLASRRRLGDVGYAAQLVGTQNIVYPPYIGRLGAMAAVPSLPDVPLSLGAEGMLVGPRNSADASTLANGDRFSLPSYVLLNATLMTRDLFIAPGHESQVALRAYNLLGVTGPNAGFSGFEYPLAPRELMLELRHTY
jgi:outer membrane receptor for ferrienterochelin and colicins